MPYAKVEDCQPSDATPIEANQTIRHFGGEASTFKVKTSGRLTGHTVWRCYTCKALAVTSIGAPCPGKCAKCGR